MKFSAIISAIAAACLLPLASLHAQEVEFDAIEEKNLISGKETLKSDKAYIFVKGPARGNGLFIKSPNEEDIAEYREYWDERMVKAQKRYTSRQSRYDRDYAAWKKSAKRLPKPEKPIEPTPANLDAQPIEQFMIASFGPQYVYSKNTEDKNNKVFSYLIEVDPGEYSYYGPIFHIPNGQTVGTCYCMGTVRFDAKAGEVTSLGDFLTLGWADDETFAKGFIALTDFERPAAKPADWSVPALLEEFGSAPADLKAARKINNFFGIRIGRMPPYEGVLEYDRDVIIDPRAKQTEEQTEGEPVAPPMDEPALAAPNAPEVAEQPEPEAEEDVTPVL